MNQALAARPMGAAQPISRTFAAKMIHPDVDAGQGTRASFVATRFDLPQAGRTATLTISAFGLYRCFINGVRVGEDILTPGWTAYDKRLCYKSYDVTDLLRQGENRIEIWLADGWYRSQLLWRHDAIFNCWGDKVGALAEITFANTDAPAVKTDESWKSGLLPILRSGIYFGEIYDAREEKLAETGGVALLDFDASVLVPQEAPAVRELAPFAPIETWADGENATIYDFGQNAAGYVGFTVTGTAGARVIVEHSEILDTDRRLLNSNYRSADARIEYILKGEGAERYRPHFTFQGFRYARIRIEGEARIIEAHAIPISSAQVRTGEFASSNALVNRLVENTVWSQRSNFVDVPTDCPQRDERLGWTGDAQVFAGTACYLHDSHDFLVKYVRDMMADQREHGEIPHFSPDPTRVQPGGSFKSAYGSTGWGDAICIIPWTLYLHYGDRNILAESIGAMERWVDFVWSISNGPIVHPPRNWSRPGFSFGDWLQPKGPSVKPLPTIGDDAAATLYLYIASDVTAKAAEVVGEYALAARMRARAVDVRDAFQHEFITSSGRLAYDDQTSYALAFLYDLIPPEKQEAAKGYFKAAIERCSGHIGTGFIGTPALLPALIKIGAPQWAELVFLQESLPGWLYQVKSGATTIWERWDAIQEDGSVFDPEMNSYNHYAYGAVCQWLFESVAGFRPDPEKPGFAHIVFEPAILPRLGPVSARHDALSGTITAGWSLEGDLATYEFDVPEGASGTLVLAPRYRDAVLDGAPLDAAPGEQGQRREVGSGHHRVQFRVADIMEQDAAIADLLKSHQSMVLPA